MLEDDKRFAKIFELLFEINEKANLFSCKRKLSNYLNKRKPSFFKEIQKKTSVKISKDFEKELRTKIRDELDLEKKTNENLARGLLVEETRLWDKIRVGGYRRVETDSDRKQRLFKLIEMYTELYNLVETVETLNAKVEKISKCEEDDDD